MIDLVLNVAALVYMAGTGFLVVFVSGFAVLLVIYLLRRRSIPAPPATHDDDLLSVTVQLPIYNEAQVVDRLLDACVRLDYPADKLHIQVLDDSNDETSEVICRKIREMAGGSRITHIRRRSRDGYKAGALAHGLRAVETDCVVIFDADFVPEADFLRKTMPYFNANPRLGLIQTRWDHLNLDTNWLTRAQALSIDAHFGVEQVARSRGHLPMSMNGTGGIWRVAAIQDAGGWSAATLTEDLDLSYRAYIRGWDFLFLVDVAVPGELPHLVQIYKKQQARWATGSTQCLLRHVRSLVMCRHCSPLKKTMGLLHLAQFAVQPVILLLFLLTPLLIWGDKFRDIPNLTIMALVGVVPPLIVALGQMELHDDWRKRLLYFPVQFVAAVAMVLSNSRAVLVAFSRQRQEFVRTPKFRLTRQQKPTVRMALQVDAVTIGELLLAVYAMAGAALALHSLPELALYMVTYALSFTVFAVWNIYQIWKFRL